MAKATAWSALEIGVRHGFQLLGMLVLARLLAPEQFGLMAIAAAFTAVAALLVDGGFGAALVQKQSTSDDDETTAFYANLVLAAMMATILLMGAQTIEKAFEQDDLAVLVAMMTLVLPLSALAAVPDALLTQRMRFRERAWIEAASSALGVATACLLALRGHGVWALGWQAIITVATRALLLWLFVGWRPRGRIRVDALRTLWRFGGYLLVANLSDVVFSRLQAVLVGHRFGVRDLGYFSMAQNAQQLPTTLVATLLNRVGLPMLSSLGADPALRRSVLRQSIRASLFLFVPVMVGLALFSDLAVRLAFGPNWAPAAPALALLALAGAAWPWLVLTGVGLNASGKSNRVLQLELAKKPFALACVLLALPAGFVAVAGALLVAATFASVMHALTCRRHLDYPLRQQAADVGPTLVFAAVAGAAAHQLRALMDDSPVRAVLTALAFFVVYFAPALIARIRAPADLLAFVRAGLRPQK